MNTAHAKAVRIGLKPVRKDCKIVGKDIVCGGVVCKVEGKELVCEEGVESKGVEEFSNSDIFLGHAYLVVIVAILSLALTQIIKPFIFKTCNNKSDAVIRLFAVLTGGGIAYSLSDPFDMIDIYMGASAGAINAFVIKVFKMKVKKSLGVDEEKENRESDVGDGDDMGDED